MKKSILSCSLIFSFVFFFMISYGQVFTGVDDLGRILPQQNEVGEKKAGKQVGIFYFLWQGDKGSPTSERNWDLSKIYQNYPEVFNDFHHPNWGGGSVGPGKYYFWGEPIYGYYRGDDYWVHLKNMQLLTDAQVDFVVIDATNRFTYPIQTRSLLAAMKTIRDQGKKSPKIVFYTNTLSADAIQEIYDNFYSKNVSDRDEDSWYIMDGKPLIIGVTKEIKGRNYEQFFTFRESQWPNESEKVNGWPWIDFQRPQKVYRNNKGEREIINVSTAQHPNLDASMGGSAFYGASGNWGRSFRKSHPGNSNKDIFYGYNVQEQWDYALTQNVPYIFITGWNEWIAGKWERLDDKKDQSWFVDQANAEYSRDIEPTWTGGLKDNYYMQMVSNILRYKGMDALKKVQSIDKLPELKGWNNLEDIYVDYVGDILKRDHPGAQSKPTVQYKNESGRNDLKTLKFASSSKELGFYVQTNNKLTERNSNNWMVLWLNTDANYNSGWFGYDYRVINGNQLQHFSNGFWKEFGTVDFDVSENELLIKIPNSTIGLPAKGFSIEFKWSDNMMKDDPLDWYINGDTAPGGRLNLTIKVE